MSQERVILKALTAEMDIALRGPTFVIPEFPFKIGRECREPRPHRPPPGVPERRFGTAVRNNDLYILETGTRFNISRQHLLLEWRGPTLFLVDLFSSCGTIVEGRYVGGDHVGGETPLAHHDVVIIGPSSSPYAFKVVIG